MIKNRSQKGITLIETLLYLSISSIVLLSISTMIGAVYRARIKNESILLVNNEGTRIAQQIKQNLETATTVSSPATSTSADSITYTDENGETYTMRLDVTTLNLTTNTTIVPLNSSHTEIKAITFSNQSNSTSHNTIRVEFTIARTNDTSIQEFSFDRTFNLTTNTTRKT